MLAASAAAAEQQQQQQEQQYQQQLKKQRRRRTTMQLANETTTGGCSATCMLEPPPDMILRLPPPPLPGFLAHTSSNYYTTRTSDGHLHSDGTDDHHPGTADHHGHSEDNEDVSLLEHFRPCKYSCSGEWRITDEGLHHVEIPQQGSIFEDTWLVILISASVGVIFIGIILATLMIRCKLNQNVDQTNDGASQCSNRSNKNSTLSTSTASSSIQTTTTTSGSGLGCSSSGASSTMGISGTYIINNKSIVRLQNEAILYPCSDAAAAAAAFHDSRVMWATLTPRGTTRHYLEDHTYETIGGSEGHLPPPPPPPPPLPTYAEVSGYMQHHHQQALPALTQHRRTYSRCDSPNEHVKLKAIPTIYLSYHSPDTYHDPPAPSPSIVTRPKDDREKAFDNTAFVDYEDPLSLKNEYYQLEDVMMEPSCDQIFSVQGLYGLPPSTGGTGGGTGVGASSTGVGGVGMVGAQHHQQRSTLVRPRVSTPTRIEHPNLPPLNQRSISKRAAGKNQQQQQQQLQQHTLGRSGSSTSSGSNSTNTTTSSYVPTI